MPRAECARGFFILIICNIYAMKILLETRFFALLAEGSSVSFEDESFKVTIREFAGELREVSEAEDELMVRERMLTGARVGLEFWLERVERDGAFGKKWGLYLLLYSCGVKIGGGRRALVT